MNRKAFLACVLMCVILTGCETAKKISEVIKNPDIQVGSLKEQPSEITVTLLSGIDEIKQLFGAKTLTVDTGADNAAGKLTFNIDGLARAIAPLRVACHWAGE